MIVLPEKHISLSESCIGLGGIILKLIEIPKSVDELYESYLTINDSQDFKAYHGFDNIILALDFLFAISAIELRKDGKIAYAST